MKRTYFIALLLLAFTLTLVPQEASALGIEVSIGYWSQDPSGDISYDGDVLSGTTLDLEENLGYDKEEKPFARVKADLPLFLPNIYVMATPMEFEGTGQENFTFNFGDETFDANVPFDSRIQLDHYDITLYYSLPFLSTATLGKLNAEVGLNARILDFEAEVTGEVLGVTTTESESFTIPIPMVYAGVQVKPVDLLSIEAEIRGIAYSSNHYYDFIGRVKILPVGPLFIAGGYRYENIEIDESDVEASLTFQGPFIEAGVDF